MIFFQLPCTHGKRRDSMSKLFTLGVLMLGIATYASAATSVVPEIDASTGVTAVTLLSGAIMVFRASRRK